MCCKRGDTHTQVTLLETRELPARLESKIRVLP